MKKTEIHEIKKYKLVLSQSLLPAETEFLAHLKELFTKITQTGTEIVIIGEDNKSILLNETITRYDSWASFLNQVSKQEYKFKNSQTITIFLLASINLNRTKAQINDVMKNTSGEIVEPGSDKLLALIDDFYSNCLVKANPNKINFDLKALKSNSEIVQKYAVSTITSPTIKESVKSLQNQEQEIDLQEELHKAIREKKLKKVDAVLRKGAVVTEEAVNLAFKKGKKKVFERLTKLFRADSELDHQQSNNDVLPKSINSFDMTSKSSSKEAAGNEFKVKNEISDRRALLELNTTEPESKIEKEIPKITNNSSLEEVKKCILAGAKVTAENLENAKDQEVYTFLLAHAPMGIAEQFLPSNEKFEFEDMEAALKDDLPLPSFDFDTSELPPMSEFRSAKEPIKGLGMVKESELIDEQIMLNPPEIKDEKTLAEVSINIKPREDKTQQTKDLSASQLPKPKEQTNNARNDLFSGTPYTSLSLQENFKMALLLASPNKIGELISQGQKIEEDDIVQVMQAGLFDVLDVLVQVGGVTSEMLSESLPQCLLDTEGERYRLLSDYIDLIKKLEEIKNSDSPAHDLQELCLSSGVKVVLYGLELTQRRPIEDTRGIVKMIYQFFNEPKKVCSEPLSHESILDFIQLSKKINKLTQEKTSESHLGTLIDLIDQMTGWVEDHLIHQLTGEIESQGIKRRILKAAFEEYREYLQKNGRSYMSQKEASEAYTKPMLNEAASSTSKILPSMLKSLLTLQQENDNQVLNPDLQRALSHAIKTESFDLIKLLIKVGAVITQDLCPEIQPETKTLSPSKPKKIELGKPIFPETIFDSSDPSFQHFVNNAPIQISAAPVIQLSNIFNLVKSPQPKLPMLNMYSTTKKEIEPSKNLNQWSAKKIFIIDAEVLYLQDDQELEQVAKMLVKLSQLDVLIIFVGKQVKDQDKQAEDRYIQAEYQKERINLLGTKQKITIHTVSNPNLLGIEVNNRKRTIAFVSDSSATKKAQIQQFSLELKSVSKNQLNQHLQAYYLEHLEKLEPNHSLNCIEKQLKICDQNQLCVAVLTGSIGKIKEFLNAGVKVTQEAFEFAINRKSIQILSLLLDSMTGSLFQELKENDFISNAKEQIKTYLELQQKLIEYAIKRNSMEVINYLLDHKNSLRNAFKGFEDDIPLSILNLPATLSEEERRYFILYWNKMTTKLRIINKGGIVANSEVTIEDMLAMLNLPDHMTQEEKRRIAQDSIIKNKDLCSKYKNTILACSHNLSEKKDFLIEESQKMLLSLFESAVDYHSKEIINLIFSKFERKDGEFWTFYGPIYKNLSTQNAQEKEKILRVVFKFALSKSLDKTILKFIFINFDLQGGEWAYYRSLIEGTCNLRAAFLYAVLNDKPGLLDTLEVYPQLAYEQKIIKAISNKSFIEWSELDQLKSFEYLADLEDYSPLLEHAIKELKLENSDVERFLFNFILKNKINCIRNLINIYNKVLSQDLCLKIIKDQGMIYENTLTLLKNLSPEVNKAMQVVSEPTVVLTQSIFEGYIAQGDIGGVKACLQQGLEVNLLMLKKAVKANPAFPLDIISLLIKAVNRPINLETATPKSHVTLIGNFFFMKTGIIKEVGKTNLDLAKLIHTELKMKNIHCLNSIDAISTYSRREKDYLKEAKKTYGKTSSFFQIPCISDSTNNTNLNNQPK